MTEINVISFVWSVRNEEWNIKNARVLFDRQPTVECILDSNWRFPIEWYLDNNVQDIINPNVYDFNDSYGCNLGHRWIGAANHGWSSQHCAALKLLIYHGVFRCTSMHWFVCQYCF